MKIDIPETLREIADYLSSPVYVVGGYVRNFLLYGPSKSTDIDICGSLTPEEIKEQLAGKAKVKDVSPRIGTILIINKGAAYEYTTFRKDSYPIGGVHTPKTVTFVSSISDDYKRRDFTVNAIYADAKTGEIIDLCGGMKDLSSKTIRTARTPEETFDEDGLRLLRLVRFASELGFGIDETTYEVAKKFANRLADITIERKRQELDKILYSDFKYGLENRASVGLKIISDLGLWQYFLKTVNLEKYYDEEKFRNILDESSKSARLIVFALVLTNSDETAITEIFSRSGLRYPNATVKQIQTARAFLSIDNEADDMAFVARNRAYIELLDEVARSFGVEKRADDIYRKMVALGLPFEYKDLNITEKDFVDYDVDPAKRGKILERITRICYEDNRVLSREEKLELLQRLKGEKL